MALKDSSTFQPYKNTGRLAKSSETDKTGENSKDAVNFVESKYPETAK